MSRLSLPWMMIRQKVGLVSDPLGAPALVVGCRLEGVPGGGNAGAAGWVKKSRSWVGRVARCCATKAAPPARGKPEASGREKKSLPTWTWKSVRAWLLRTGVAPHPLRSGCKRPRMKGVFWLWAGLLGGYPLGPSTDGLWTAPNPVAMVFQ